MGNETISAPSMNLNNQNIQAPYMVNNTINPYMQPPMSAAGGLFSQLPPVNNYANDLFAPDFMKQNYYPQMNNTQFQTPNLTQTSQYPSQSIQTNPFDTTLNMQTQNLQQQYIQPTQGYAQPMFTGGINQNSITQNQSEDTNTDSKTNVSKKSAAILGALTPIVTSAYKVFKGVKLTDAFKFKELAIKVPVLAVAGWCIGSIVDGIINSSKKDNA